ncbi:matrixin family metalloprotease [Amycolatopsis cynarae]|uniref:Matrixin family metalloprotease n=1 Tax=Amycolatopsis cynarae TaxID=2995223 RepID=A0ABY7AW03_9PSEU|nr:matrixin family metalloprotease [Amycolatopsis sp. HUAS 11-8]WAL63927.1 matrixin family metalloprotease [Amycolatopsis sp. HUAS 11-8]
MPRKTLPLLLAIALCAFATGLHASRGVRIVVVAEAILAGTPASAALAGFDTTDACTDPAYVLAPWHLTGPYQWYYNPAGAPPEVADTALPTIQTATQTVLAGHNRCGLPAALGTSQRYLGTTTRTAGISPSGACTGDDGYSVTSWGRLPPSYLAYTCVYYNASTGAVLSSDLMIDNSVHHWFTTPPAACLGAYDLQSVATHERGHTAGLAHVDQSRHATETMSAATRPCDTTERLLALGDLTGLKKLYSPSG